MLELVLLVVVASLAFANGANDNFKGVATLLGSGTLSFRAAVGWGTLTTAAGSVTALALAHGLLEAFSGKGLVPDEVIATAAFRVAVVIGAGATVLLATRRGLPISTTHALIGGLCGAGAVSSPELLRLDALTVLMLPLLTSPVIAALAAYVLAGRSSRWKFRSVALVDASHFVSGGLVGFARGLNDTPKIAALMLAGTAIAPSSAILLVTIAMVVGGLVGARRVAKTISFDVTSMTRREGSSVNFTTGMLTIGASFFGVPVSTTHVSLGALFGLGARNAAARRDTIRAIVAAWLLTLPLAAAIAATCALVLS